ncbi:death-on-curing protein [Desulfitispora alkaliphila]|uniref:hypothetical protein n=1 Tax=Desulfitispora alkaliphila TaxID=622674 RepID=UPI003D1E9763
MRSITLDHILLFHKKIVSRTGGSDGVRDVGLIEGALNRGLMTFDGEELYKETEEKLQQ